MATVRDIVQRAYRKIGIVALDEPMTAEMAAVGLDALNMMMSGLELAGIDVAWTEADLSDQFQIEPRFHEGLVYMLASRLAPDFAVPGFDPIGFMRGMAAAYLIVPDSALDGALTARRVGLFL